LCLWNGSAVERPRLPFTAFRVAGRTKASAPTQTYGPTTLVIRLVRVFMTQTTLPVPRGAQAGEPVALPPILLHPNVAGRWQLEAPIVILALYVWGSRTSGAENFLPRDFRLPDECPRLRKGRGNAGAGRISAGGDGRAGRSHSLQHMFDPRQSGAESLPSTGGFQEAAGSGKEIRRAGMCGAAGRREDF